MSSQLDVFIESGRRRTFASALDWPGWARRGTTEELAVQALADYLPRYLVIVRLAGLPAPAGDLAVTEPAFRAGEECGFRCAGRDRGYRARAAGR